MIVLSTARYQDKLEGKWKPNSVPIVADVLGLEHKWLWLSIRSGIDTVENHIVACGWDPDHVIAIQGCAYYDGMPYEDRLAFDRLIRDGDMGWALVLAPDIKTVDDWISLVKRTLGMKAFL